MAQPLYISDIQLFNALKGKLGEKEAEQLVQFVKTEVEANAEKKYEYISKYIRALRDELYKTFATKEDVVNSKIDLIKWMFGFVERLCC